MRATSQTLRPTRPNLPRRLSLSARLNLPHLLPRPWGRSVCNSRLVWYEERKRSLKEDQERGLFRRNWVGGLGLPKVGVCSQSLQALWARGQQHLPGMIQCRMSQGVAAGARERV